MSRSDPIGNLHVKCNHGRNKCYMGWPNLFRSKFNATISTHLKKSREILRPDNETGEKVVQPNEDGGKNHGRRHCRNARYESLAEIGIYC